MANRPVTLHTPLSAEALWKQLAEVLPWLVRLYLERSTASAENPPRSVAYRPAIQGPFGNSYRSSEFSAHGTAELLSPRSFVLNVAAPSPRGLLFCALQGEGDPIERFAVIADDEWVEPIVAILNREGVACTLGEK